MDFSWENDSTTWKAWVLRGLVLLSLSLQVLLIIFGSRRKYIGGGFISSVVWLAYLSADWLATFSLGVLADSVGDKRHSRYVLESPALTEDRDGVLRALWAPFLLLHLGGPDTVTAYSIDDNMWRGHLLQLLVQLVVAGDIVFWPWANTALTYIAIPVFISGIIKYSERNWVLRSVSPQQFEDCLVSAPAERLPAPTDLGNFNNDKELECLHKAYSLFSCLLKRLYANLSLPFSEGQQSYLLTKTDNADPHIWAFKLIELQLGFLYDELFTKANVIYSRCCWGFARLIITLFLTLFALGAFFFCIDSDSHSRIDIDVTYILFFGAIGIEIYAFISLVVSNRTIYWLTKETTSFCRCLYSAITCCRSVLCDLLIKEWSQSIGQHNLVSFCSKNRLTEHIGSEFLFSIYFKVALSWQRTSEDVDPDLKKYIFEHLLEKHQAAYGTRGFDYSGLKSLLADRGDSLLQRREHFRDLGSSIAKRPFDDSLVIWHIATDIRFELDRQNQNDSKCKASKKISNYMLYVLLMCPFMLPKWNDRISYLRDMYKKATNVLHEGNRSESHESLINKGERLLAAFRRADHPVFRDASNLAVQLGQESDRWEMICEVWIAKLTYAASHCEWKAHAQQLPRGGEFLTHVCLLMADLGLSQQFNTGTDTDGNTITYSDC